MKVLIINSVCGYGSTGRICCDLAEAVRNEGGEAMVAYGRNGAVPEAAKRYSRRIGSDTDVRLHGILTRVFDLHGFGSGNATRELTAWIRRFDPDIIHLHNLHGYYVHIGVLFEALRALDRPILWTLHDCWPFTGHCAHYSAVGCEKWKNGCHDCGMKRVYPASLLLNHAGKNYEMKKRLFTLPERMTLVTPSQWLAGEVRQSFLGKYPLATIPNGIDTEVFRPAQSGLRERYGLEKKKIALGVANVWSEQKGLSYLLALADQLGNGWAVVLAGLSKQQIRTLPKNIIGIPRTESPWELAAWYSAADVFVNPTLGDSFPSTNLEAQACGTPAVTFRTGGSPEGIYPPLREKMVCRERTVQALAECVRFAGALPSCERQKIMEWCAENYRKEEQTQAYLGLYRSLMEAEREER